MQQQPDGGGRQHTIMTLVDKYGSAVVLMSEQFASSACTDDDALTCIPACMHV
jgi:hypothetical protein